MKLTELVAAVCVALVAATAACSSPRPTSSANVAVPAMFHTDPWPTAMADAVTTKETRVFDTEAAIDSDLACNYHEFEGTTAEWPDHTFVLPANAHVQIGVLSKDWRRLVKTDAGILGVACKDDFRLL